MNCIQCECKYSLWLWQQQIYPCLHKTLKLFHLRGNPQVDSLVIYLIKTSRLFKCTLEWAWLSISWCQRSQPLLSQPWRSRESSNAQIRFIVFHVIASNQCDKLVWTMWSIADSRLSMKIKFHIYCLLWSHRAVRSPSLWLFGVCSPLTTARCLWWGHIAQYAADRPRCIPSHSHIHVCCTHWRSLNHNRRLTLTSTPIRLTPNAPMLLRKFRLLECVLANFSMRIVRYINFASSDCR